MSMSFSLSFASLLFSCLDKKHLGIFRSIWFHHSYDFRVPYFHSLAPPGFGSEFLVVRLIEQGHLSKHMKI